MSDKITLTPRQQQIISNATVGEWFSAGTITSQFPQVSAPTLRRDLGELVDHKMLEKTGENKGVKYAITERSRLFIPYELGDYYSKDIDQRSALTSYNFALFPAITEVPLITEGQLTQLQDATRIFHDNATNMSLSLRRKELERFVIEFSWKSSKIEGNTYTLLDTEFLLKNGIEAIGKSKFEAKMIINHKNAYLFAVQSMPDTTPIDVAYIEQLHYLVTEGLGVDRGVRNRIVGISGSAYTPLEMRQQLREQLEMLIQVISGKDDPYEQALTAVLGISYLQPFEDGNKRTARVLANSLLLRAGMAPLSYRGVDEREYKEATLIFYEQNSLQPFRDLFVDQYIYSATHYNIAEPRSA